MKRVLIVSVGKAGSATVLLRGDSGTGKELFAHAIHNENDRKHHKFIRVNCASVTENILATIRNFYYKHDKHQIAKKACKPFHSAKICQVLIRLMKRLQNWGRWYRFCMIIYEQVHCKQVGSVLDQPHLRGI